MNYLIKKKGKAGQELLMFVLVLVIYFIAFGFCGFLAFSSDVDDFRSLLLSCLNALRFSIGGVDYDALVLSSRTFGSVYYVVWSIDDILSRRNLVSSVHKTGLTFGEAPKFIDEFHVDKAQETLLLLHTLQVPMPISMEGPRRPLPLQLLPADATNTRLDDVHFQRLIDRILLIQDLLKAHLRQTKAGAKIIKDIEHTI
ncbi:hypothetical protein RFI_30865 [Reticulomyxa filosa]|uniref:Polycystin cation channel PKD1/PKD2 domain-containing protein n=1 Tax=Reticulomyxa filosa TaxID=46433 RepID=X6LZF4_RETFI|nr:hypothetical protein RFI_30865 [Reticulomyxa filosa]|eukprot:ETO06527.1 hypothetical protein RFI_30865 [Reticulomyxa filosa]